MNNPLRVMVASTSPRAAHRLESLLSSHESVMVPGTVDSTTDLLRRAHQEPFDVLLSDLDLTGFESIQVTRTLVVNGREVRLIRVEDPRTGAPGFDAVQIGVADFQRQPFSRDEFLAVVRTALTD
jgi:DNA-binding NarL/FixJ family response regulator